MRLWTAIRMTLVLTILTGIIYPVLITAISAAIFPFQANGSLLTRHGRVIGSRLIGQNFNSPRYFHGRPSAAGDKGYDATSSGGSNLGPTNKALIDAARQRLKENLEQNPGTSASDVPTSQITASASGLDPEISPAGALMQLARVAKVRGISEQVALDLIRTHTRSRWAGVLGEPGVNVLELNLALDDLTGALMTAAKSP
ncbi:MAG TPA: potassium-transporting ATPase subunit KdpC [Candidatus Binataceae bacterium]|nr:potassium-transporting ATPase subunit KdpC [Candidatus Binataceae bacterium]